MIVGSKFEKEGVEGYIGQALFLTQVRTENLGNTKTVATMKV